MPAKSNLLGMKFSNLSVIRYVGLSKFGSSLWECECDCGNKKVIPTNGLTSGQYKSCGCLKKERFRNSITIHGQSKTRLYKIWKNMKTRCLNPNNHKFKSYGLRGINVCEEWKNNFEQFYEWAINNGYNDSLTIERIDVNGNYEPLNCTWIEHDKQALNRTNTRKVIFNGQKMSVKEFSFLTGINEATIYKHLRNGIVDFTDYVNTGLPFWTVG